MCSERVKCLGISRHAASAQLISGDGALLAEVGQDLERGNTESRPDHDTGPFCCDIPVRKARTVILHVLAKGVLGLTMAIDRRVVENLTQHWKIIPSVPHLPRLLSEASMWSETTQLLPIKEPKV